VLDPPAPPAGAAPGAPSSDFYFIARDDAEAARATIVELVAERIPARFGFDPIADIQVLAPMHRGELGTAALNRALQDRLNPGPGASPAPTADPPAGGSELTGAGPRDATRDGVKAPVSIELARGERVFRSGDKVMQLRNDYDKSVFNGDIGVIAAIDGEAGVVSVEFDGRLASYERSELDQLTHAYAVSVHKSQGSEYAAVVIPLVTQHYMMLQRSLLYTAVTRGKRLVVIVGSKRAVTLAVRNAEARRRYTWLAERVRAQMAAQITE
jgi:exodeoxyribonuclease V alpha subunit